MLTAGLAPAHAGGIGDFFDDFGKARAEGKVTHAVDIDNDTLLLNRNDGFYSSGMAYRQEHTLRGADETAVFGWRIGQELYTPSDIKLPASQVSLSDHPYAGWLYGGVYKQTYRADGTHMLVGIDIGCLGPCSGGEWTQTNFHRIIDQPLPQGWSKQVKNEVGAVLYADVAPVRWAPLASVDVTPSIKGRFGNIFTDVGAGVTVRAGRLNTMPRAPSFFGYLRADARAVGYNATLQGGYFSANNLHTVDPKRWVGEAELGVSWSSGVYGARFAVVRRSNEISGLPNSVGAQTFARLEFSYTP